MNHAEILRGMANESKKKLPEGISELFDQIIENIHSCARKGLYGAELKVDMPDHLTGFCPSIVGDLRGSGLVVDIISVESIGKDQGLRIQMYITW